jgi:prepilin-type N-terminal cleavage/methylation domain-containing protein
MKTQRNKSGFTLAEIMISVSIIGIITAVALPNFFRIREEVNMEMVRGNLKVIHEAMNELLNETGLFPDDIFGFAEEDGDARAAIAANLTAIDIAGFDTNFENLDGEYFIRSCSRVLGRCFGVDPLGVHTLFAFDGRGANSFIFGIFLMDGVLNVRENFLVDPNIPDDVKAEIMSARIEMSAHMLGLRSHMPSGGEYPALQIKMSNESGLAYDGSSESLFPKMYENLKAAGFETMFQSSEKYQGPLVQGKNADNSMYPDKDYDAKQVKVLFHGDSLGKEYNEARSNQLSQEVYHFLETGDWDGGYLYEDGE